MSSGVRFSPRLIAALCLLLPSAVSAQNIGDQGGAAPAPAPAAPPGKSDANNPSAPGATQAGAASPGTVTLSPPQTTTSYSVFGLPQPGFNPDAHLPSSSRSSSDASRSTDGFDLLPDQGT